MQIFLLSFPALNLLVVLRRRTHFCHGALSHILVSYIYIFMTIPNLQTGRRQVCSTGTAVYLGFASGFGWIVERRTRGGQEKIMQS